MNMDLSANGEELSQMSMYERLADSAWAAVLKQNDHPGLIQ